MDVEKLEEIINKGSVDYEESISEVERKIIKMIEKKDEKKRYSKKLINYVFEEDEESINLFNKLYNEYKYLNYKKYLNDKRSKDRKKYNEYSNNYYYKNVKDKNKKKKNMKD